MPLRFSTILRAAPALLGVALALGLSACPEDPRLCPAGERCVCGAETFCRLRCDGADCEFECRPGARCGFECDDGGCTALCSESQPCDMVCPGGGCTMDCRDGSDCDMYECDECVLDCDDSSECDHDDLD